MRITTSIKGRFSILIFSYLPVYKSAVNLLISIFFFMGVVNVVVAVVFIYVLILWLNLLAQPCVYLGRSFSFPSQAGAVKRFIVA